LSRQAGSTTPRQYRSTQCAARFQGSFNVCAVLRQNHTNGKLPIVRRIRRVERPRACVKLHVAAQPGFQTRFKFAMRSKTLVVQPGLIQNCKNVHVRIVARSARRPLFHHNAQIVQLPDRRFHVAPYLRPVLR
jgi:hypothetical protein